MSRAAESGRVPRSRNGEFYVNMGSSESELLISINKLLVLKMNTEYNKGVVATAVEALDRFVQTMGNSALAAQQSLIEAIMEQLRIFLLGKANCQISNESMTNML